jgi:hypothetical protein
LRVLGEQTLEINKGVKDSPVLDPSLAKEVEDPSLTILHQLQVVHTVEKKRSAQIQRVFQ